MSAIIFRIYGQPKGQPRPRAFARKVGDKGAVSWFDFKRAKALDAEAASQPDALVNSLPARVLAMCKARGWDTGWSARGCYLHLESSEFVEALRGKRGEPLSEAADVLLVLMSMTEGNGINFSDVIRKVEEHCTRLETAPRYAGESFTAEGNQSSSHSAVGTASVLGGAA